MSLTDRHHTILIGTGSLLTGTLTLVDEEPEITGEGWDSLTQVYYQRRVTCTAEDVAVLFPVGGQLPLRTWWITGARPRRIEAGFWEIRVSYKGWGDEKPAVIRVGSSANQQSASGVRAPDFVGDTVGSIYAKVETHENMPDISVSYLTANVVTGSMTDQVGTAVTPPVSIAVPDTVWTFMTEFVYHWPNGWVLMSSAQDRLPGTSAAWVTDSYKYIREKTPG